MRDGEEEMLFESQFLSDEEDESIILATQFENSDEERFEPQHDDQCFLPPSIDFSSELHNFQ